MVGFLSTKFVMRSLVEHSIKKEILPTQSVSPLIKVDVMDGSNYIPVKKLNSGFQLHLSC